ncbi:MAG TPA: hypothetical protein VHV78_13780, partial [Gemmatimonadaceae bacterium]|nr:hypothetical protein [Gemmatimonadaceae bacterium]
RAPTVPTAKRSCGVVVLPEFLPCDDLSLTISSPVFVERCRMRALQARRQRTNDRSEIAVRVSISVVT